jgi:outer membrane protein assembly factor BamB
LASRWATSIGTSAGAPLVEADGVIYAHSELPASTLWAIRASTGTVLWSTPLPASGWDAPPIVHGGAVFVRSNHPLAHARLEAFSAADGHRLWAQDLSGTLVQSAPVFAHGMLYIQSEDPSGVDALDPETGQQVWQADPDPLHQSSISGVSVSRKTVYAPVGQHLYALNALTGAVRWTSPAAPGGAFETAPSIMGNTAYIATHGVLWAIDTGTGAVRWSKITAGMPAATTSAAVYYVGDPWNGGGGCAMYAISPTGALRWHTHLPACAAINTWPRPVVAHGVVYYTSGTGHLYALATSSGKLLVDLPVAATGLTSPMVVNGKVYAVDADGTVHALGLG